MKLLIVLASVAALALTGCASTGTTSYKAAKAGVAERALRAPLVGSVAPGTSSDPRVQVLLKSGVVGLAQHEVADYMDRQEAELRAELQGTGVKSERIGEQIKLTLPGNIVFATNSADIRSDFFVVLNSISKVLGTFDQTVIDVSGHTDSTGSNSINQPLSQRRADSVATYLRSQKIDSRRIASDGLGSTHPIASNDSPAGREQNRRIEILLTPLLASPPDISALQAYTSGADGDPDAVQYLADASSEPELVVDAGTAETAEPDLVVDADLANG
jgi:outer membrane protein OmpA-like peptidoglycan-associated protein